MKHNKFIASCLIGILFSTTPVFASTTITTQSNPKLLAKASSKTDTQTSTKPILTVESAISSALASNASLALNAEEAKLISEQLSSSNNLTAGGYQQKYISQLQNEKDREYLIDSISYNVRSTYNTVVLQKLQIENYQLDIDLKTIQLSQLATKKNLGLVTELEYNAAQLELSNLKSTLAAAQSTLKSNMTNLGILTGRAIEQYNLESTIEYEPFTVKTNAIEPYFRGKVESYLEHKHALVKSQENHMFENYVYAPTYAEYLAKKFSISSTETTLENTEDSLTQALLTSYSNLLALHEQITTLEENYAFTKNQLKTYSLKYELGLISKLDYLNQENALKDIEYNLLSLKNQCSTLAEMLQKPWLMA